MHILLTRTCKAPTVTNVFFSCPAQVGSASVTLWDTGCPCSFYITNQGLISPALQNFTDSYQMPCRTDNHTCSKWTILSPSVRPVSSFPWLLKWTRRILAKLLHVGLILILNVSTAGLMDEPCIWRATFPWTLLEILISDPNPSWKLLFLLITSTLHILLHLLFQPGNRNTDRSFLQHPDLLLVSCLYQEPSEAWALQIKLLLVKALVKPSVGTQYIRKWSQVAVGEV